MAQKGPRKEKDNSFKGTLQRMMERHLLDAEDVKEIVTELLISAAEEVNAAGNKHAYQKTLDVMRDIESRIEDLGGL